ncbi:hypothetical protein PoB_005755100 [Plakobranchus ocellatus]|uniref:Uncharacterized protein n=1 Tax=Plakobranchus ocellatus TaxID=259542 RepID=A0AAV4C6Y0_9GAST|nr:hypothetical protein PoB_005755100 [Plakobranchus ocellatus]
MTLTPDRLYNQIGVRQKHSIESMWQSICRPPGRLQSVFVARHKDSRVFLAAAILTLESFWGRVILACYTGERPVFVHSNILIGNFMRSEVAVVFKIVYSQSERVDEPVVEQSLLQTDSNNNRNFIEISPVIARQSDNKNGHQEIAKIQGCLSLKAIPSLKQTGRFVACSN